MTPVSRVQHMNSISAKLQRARRSGSAHRNTVAGRATSISTVTTAMPPSQYWLISAKSTWAPSRMKMNRRRMNAVVSTNSSSFCASPGFHLEAEGFLVAEHDAEHEHRHEAAGLQAVGGEIGADHGDQRHDRGVFGEKCHLLMRDQERREIAEHGAGDNADDGLLDEIEQ